MEETIKAKSASTPGSFYNVTFAYEDGKLKVLCDCPAGSFGKFCKHKWELLGENLDMLFDEEDADKLSTVAGWAQERGVYAIRSAIGKIRNQIESLQKDLKKEQKKIEHQLKHGF